MKVLRWFRNHWYVPLTIIIGALGFFVGRGGPRASLARELDAIDAGERARLDAADRGAELANRIIDAEHRATLAELDVRKRAKADRMRANPGARAKWLTKLAKDGDG